MRGLFLSHRDLLRAGGGGVQVCTREYVDTIEAAGVSLTMLPFGVDTRLSTRLARRLVHAPYFRVAEPGLEGKVAALAAEARPDVIFLNQVALSVLAADIRARVPRAAIVLLSHGLESTDLIHLARLRATLPLSGSVRPSEGLVLGQTLATERRTRADVDLVLTLSPFDSELESWIGAKRVAYLPRIVTPSPIGWHPTGARVGYLGTLDHAPNLDGLVQVLQQLPATGDMRVRVVGGPEGIGTWLVERFPQVDYLGRLDDDGVRNEAGSWNAFLHPIFCRARGCSTKLATAMAWEIPIVTTTTGHRGYEWQEGGLTVGDDPASFAKAMLALLDPQAARAAQARVAQATRTSPSLGAVASRLRAELSFISPAEPSHQSAA